MMAIVGWRSNNGKGRRDTWDRTWEKIERRSTAECWEWLGSKTIFGHGVVLPEGRRTYTSAHRVAYQMYYGVTLPTEMCVLHRCDNPSCCNPHHLFTGTKGDNNRDAASKGRNHKQRMSPLFCKRNHRRFASGDCPQCKRIRNSKNYQPTRGTR
jgi:hypothetical protein